MSKTIVAQNLPYWLGVLRDQRRKQAGMRPYDEAVQQRITLLEAQVVVSETGAGEYTWEPRGQRLREAP